jgi:hypothetical protein
MKSQEELYQYLEKLLRQFKKLENRWCADEVDDPEEMWDELPEWIEDKVLEIENILE